MKTLLRKYPGLLAIIAILCLGASSASYQNGTKYLPGSAETLSLSAATTGTGFVKQFTGYSQLVWDVDCTGTVASGTMKIESNGISSTYAGTWFEVDSIDLSTLSGGKAYHGTYPGNNDWTRARLSANVVGGGGCSARLNALANN